MVIPTGLLLATETGFKSPFNLALTMEIKEKINFKKYKAVKKTFNLTFPFHVPGASSI